MPAKRGPEQGAALTDRSSVRQAFAPTTRARGDAYFERGMVVGAARVSPHEVRADVMGSSLYETWLHLHEGSGELSVSCSCPVGSRYDEPCKHLWAVLREIDERKLLPAGRHMKRLRVRLADEEEAGAAEDPHDAEELDELDDPAGVERVGAWQGAWSSPAQASGSAPARGGPPRSPRVLLDALLVPSHRDRDPAPRPELPLKALLRLTEANEVTVRVSLVVPIGGGYRPVHVQELISCARPGTLHGDLALLALRDDDEFTALGGSEPPWRARPPGELTLPWYETARLLKRLAEARLLLTLNAQNTVAPVVLHTGEATLRLAVVVEPGEAAYRIVPRVLVGDREVTFDSLSFVHGSGTLLFDGTLVSVRSPGEAEWLATLKQHDAADLVLSADELESFLERYYGASDLPELELPPGLELRVRELAPERFLDVGKSDGSSQGLPLNVGLRYGDKELPLYPRRPWVVDLAAGARYRRDSKFETELRLELEQLGARLVVSDASTFRIGAKRVHELASQLLARGWHVSVERRAYRRVEGFHLRASSGIDWLEISGTVEVDGQALPLGELLRALSRRRRTRALVELDANTVAVGAEDFLNRFERLLELGASLEPSQGTLRLPTVHAGAAVALLEAATSSDYDAGFSKLRQALERGRLPLSSDAPRGFRGTLREYQRQGLGWLRWLAEIGFGGCLADDMGLGKTIQVLALLLGRGRRHGPSLVVVPRSVLHNWASEARRFAPALAPTVHWGPERATSPQAFRDRRLVITSYATLARDIELLSQVQWDYLVVDEAQAIKNPRTESARLARDLKSQHRLALTGTPVENHLDELWALLDFLNPGFGRGAPFKSTTLSDSEAALVRALIKPFILRRTKHQVAKDLPERVEQTLGVELSRSERQRYDELAKKLRRKYATAVAELGIQRSTPVLLTGLLRLRQAACHQGLLDDRQRQRRSSKLAVLIERLGELKQEGAKSLVFSQFTGHLDLVEAELVREGIGFVRLDGKTRSRAQRVHAFQNDASVSVFLISLKAGGTGLNLTAAEYVFLLDPWWNPAAEAQAIDRAHRIGQTSRVIAYRLIAADTVEEKVMALQKRKRELVDSVFGDEQAFLGRMSHDDLSMLLDG